MSDFLHDPLRTTEALLGKTPDDKRKTAKELAARQYVCPHCKKKIDEVKLFGEQRWKAPIRKTTEGGEIDLDRVLSDHFDDDNGPEVWIDAECPECGESVRKDITGDIEFRTYYKD